MKSKLVKIYEDKKSGALFVRSTDDKFRLKSDTLGKALGKNTSDDELGKTVRKILLNSD
jgi:hypothetical protein